MSAAVEVFLAEARELIDGLEDQLLALESDPDPERVDAVFRALHTVKGSGAMFGFATLSAFLHHFETAFDKVRSGRLAVDRSLIDLSLGARDHATALLDCGGDGPAATALAETEEARALLAALAALTGAAADAPAAAAPADAGPRVRRRFEIAFRPEADALASGMRPELLIEELIGLGEAMVRLDASGVPPLAELDPTECRLGWRVELETSEPRSAIEAGFVFADDAGLSIEERVEAPAGTVAPAAARAADAPARTPAGTERPRRAAEGESLRIPAARLDALMDQVGELVIAQARLERVTARLGDSALSGVAEEVERFVTGLRDSTLSLRMLPVDTVFSRFRRVVRDLSAELGKEVTLEIDGAETEIDKSVLDRLSEPLVHMIRNAIDHGLEDARTRRAAGKPAAGLLRLSARQEGGEVTIAIEDDGRGLDAEAIRRRAAERGLIGADERPPDAVLHQLIFAPGFSTAETLSSVSGRGVGMDAVRSAVEALRGKIDVDTAAGRGTRVTLSIPLTLAIIDGFAVALGGAVYVLPLAVVEECVEHDGAARAMIELRGSLVPIVDLAVLFAAPPAAGTERRVVVVRAGATRAGLVVDDVLGQRQTVVKTPSPYHRDVPGFSGATILGDGRVALILDASALVALARTGQPPESCAA
ncbi:MAG: chemotaxis protein CheA [Paracoccaceae bacterium]